MMKLIAAALLSMAMPALASELKLIPTHNDAKEVLVRESVENGVTVVEYQAVDGGWVKAQTVSAEQAAKLEAVAFNSGEAKLHKVDYYGDRPQQPQQPDPGYDVPQYGDGGYYGGGGVWGGGGCGVNCPPPPCVQNCGYVAPPPPCYEPCNDPPPCVDPCYERPVPLPTPTPYYQPNYYSNGYMVRRQRIIRPIQAYPHGRYNYRKYRF